MEDFNIINTLLLTIIETIMNIYFSFLIVGESRHLPFKDDKKLRKKNVLKFIAIVLIISLFTDTSMIFIVDENARTLSSLAFAAIMIFVFYRINVLKSIAAVLIYATFLLSIEGPYMSLVTTIIFKSNQNLFESNYFFRFALSIPIRLLQLTGIVSVWNFKVALDSAKKIKHSKIKIIGLLLLLLILEMSLYYNFCYTYTGLNLTNKILGFLGIFSAGGINYFILSMYISTINKAIRYNINNNKRKEGILK